MITTRLSVSVRLAWEVVRLDGSQHGSQAESAWMTPLSGLTYFPSPITRDKLQGYMAAVLDLKARLEEAYGDHVYYPFYRYRPQELRATQAYLLKFPAQLLTVFQLDMLGGAQVASSPVEPSRRSTRGSGYLKDVEVKRAVERRAVRLARAHFEADGYSCKDAGTTRSYDLHLTKGPEEIHMEVKGSTGTAATVELTSNEVIHSRSTLWQTQLIVVDQITWTRRSGKVVASGGRLRVWPAWRAECDNLAVTRYRYQLPDQETQEQHGDPTRRRPAASPKIEPNLGVRQRTLTMARPVRSGRWLRVRRPGCFLAGPGRVRGRGG